MIDWLSFFLGGLLGSAHCVGMCGGIAVTVGGRAVHTRAVIGRQTIYSVGRIATYAFLGAIGGFAGLWLARRNPSLINFQRTLSIVAGVIMVGVALSILGWRPFAWIRRLIAVIRGSRNNEQNTYPLTRGAPSCVKSDSSLNQGCGAGLTSLFGDFVRQDRWLGAFLAGLATGFLPCGLVYAFLAKATAAGDVATGALAMICFGIGTVPAMMLAGCGGSLISHQLRGRLFRLAACFVLAVGLLTIYRGWSASLQAPCPACETNDHDH